MSLHVVTLTSVWPFTSICVSGLRIHFHERKRVNQTPYRGRTALYADPACTLGRVEKGIWRRGEVEIHLPPSYCWKLLGSGHLKLHVGVHHWLSSSVSAPSLTNADNGSMVSRIEHCSCKREESTCVRC